MRLDRDNIRFTFEPCPEEVAFRFRDGTTARSLSEFRAELARLPAADLHHHRLHFEHWLRDILGDSPLAARVRTYGAGDMPPPTFRDVLVDLVDRRLDTLTRVPQPVPAKRSRLAALFVRR